MVLASRCEEVQFEQREGVKRGLQGSWIEIRNRSRRERRLMKDGGSNDLSFEIARWGSLGELVLRQTMSLSQAAHSLHALWVSGAAGALSCWLLTHHNGRWLSIASLSHARGLARRLTLWSALHRRLSLKLLALGWASFHCSLLSSREFMISIRLTQTQNRALIACFCRWYLLFLWDDENTSNLSHLAQTKRSSNLSQASTPESD